MTARKNTTLAVRRREAKERRERQRSAAEIAAMKVSKDYDPTEMLKATKAIIALEIQRMAAAQGEGQPITPNDARKLMQMVNTISQMLAIADKTKPDLSTLSDEELAALAGVAQEGA